MYAKLIALIAISIHALPPANAATTRSDDAKLLLGVWVPVKWTFGGSSTPPPGMASMKLTLKRGTYEFLEGPSLDAGRVALRSGKKPKEMDIAGVKGPNAGHKIPAIYNIQGGRLTICYGLDGHRPKEFRSPNKSLVLLVVFKRHPAPRP